VKRTISVVTSGQPVNAWLGSDGLVYDSPGEGRTPYGYSDWGNVKSGELLRYSLSNGRILPAEDVEDNPSLSLLRILGI